ncbi:MAG: ribonuclease III [Robiginitomaculum sp.]|nr:MAG: ribonuclease III [Robiginitomaculum sp.]
MDNSPNLSLPYIMPAQAQKHVTHNEAIRKLDALTQLSVINRSLNTAPSSPVNGARYIVASMPTTDWETHEDEIAVYEDNGWAFITPQTGWLAWVEADENFVVWNTNAWEDIYAPDIQNIPFIGINATADATNRLSINAPAILLNHEGAGHQLKINKNTPSDTASLLFQSGFSGHAEMGLTGDNNLHFKVSEDGSNWHNSFEIENHTGHLITPSQRSGTLTIADDSVATISTPQAGGFLLILNTGAADPQITHAGIFVYAAGTSLSLIDFTLATNMQNKGTDTLTGTSGIDGKTSLAVALGQIQIENRFGSSQKYSYTFIG